VLASAGNLRNDVFHFSKEGGRSTTPLFSLDAAVLDMAVDAVGQLWVMTGKELLEKLRGEYEVLRTEHGVSIKSVPIAGMANDLELVEQLQPIEDDLRGVLQLVEDTSLQAGSEAWEAYLAHYGMLASMADRDAELAAALAPVVEFMAVGRRAKKPADNK